MLTQLVHNGVVVPDLPPPLGLVLTIRGTQVPLSPAQEGMALAWARKQGTPYVSDRTFVRNFLEDFTRALGLEPALSEPEVDFGPAIRVVEAERQAKAQLSPEERAAQAAERKARREALRDRFGRALVDGEPVLLANYIVEPGGIFMGRGKHPLRGRWKEGARQNDITLNLSPDAAQPSGAWQIVWQPESLWVARWQDKLSGKMKYVWLSDTAPVKQSREAAKFDRARSLDARLEQVRVRFEQDLSGSDSKCRMIATACYLIDALCLRVGDEKEPDEADTVGATTLRPEHVTLHPDGRAEFRFLGKDSVLWHKSLVLPPAVSDSLAELVRAARPARSSGNGERGHPTRDLPQLFPDISSSDVNAYLGSILPRLTAKVFRTHHATHAVHTRLEAEGVEQGDPDHRKWEAASLANLDAAVLCNHTRQVPAGWSGSRQKLKERQEKAEERLRACREQVKALREPLAALQAEAREKKKSAAPEKRAQLRERYGKRIEAAERRLAVAESRLESARLALGKSRAEAAVAAKKRSWNLGTSLKSYIDPRVYHRWGQAVGYDVLERYYPAALRQKFAWVRGTDTAEPDDGSGGEGS
jgi:DNA topoisomerase-1